MPKEAKVILNRLNPYLIEIFLQDFEEYQSRKKRDVSTSSRPQEDTFSDDKLDPIQHISCQNCGKTFADENLRALHQVFAHRAKTMTDWQPQPRQFSCDFCDKTFDNTDTLYDHERLVHVPRLSQQCHICDYDYYC